MKRFLDFILTRIAVYVTLGFMLTTGSVYAEGAVVIPRDIIVPVTRGIKQVFQKGFFEEDSMVIWNLIPSYVQADLMRSFLTSESDFSDSEDIRTRKGSYREIVSYFDSVKKHLRDKDDELEENYEYMAALMLRGLRRRLIETTTRYDEGGYIGNIQGRNTNLYYIINDHSLDKSQGRECNANYNLYLREFHMLTGNSDTVVVRNVSAGRPTIHTIIYVGNHVGMSNFLYELCGPVTEETKEYNWIRGLNNGLHRTRWSRNDPRWDDPKNAWMLRRPPPNHNRRGNRKPTPRYVDPRTIRALQSMAR